MPLIHNIFRIGKTGQIRRWQIFYLSLMFVLFIVSEILIFTYRIHNVRSEMGRNYQYIYASLVDNYIVKNQLFPERLDSLNRISAYIRETLYFQILDENGDVVFDSRGMDGDSTSNQSRKIEVKRALLEGEGWHIRSENESDEKQMFYAAYKNGYIVRVVVPVSEQIQPLMKPGGWFITSIIMLTFFVFCYFLSIHLFYRKSIRKLNEFVKAYRDNQSFPTHLPNPDQELDEVQDEIVDIYNRLKTKEKDAIVERERLLEHFHFSEEGISFFTPQFENIYTNSHFIQYLNVMLDEPTMDVQQLFKSPVFNSVVRFIENPEGQSVFSDKLHVNGGHFHVRVILFDDKSFEIIIRDISEAEKRRIDQAEVTNNIAHELRTPVTSVRGYLETLLEYEKISPEKKKEYLERAYKQMLRLSEIIKDVILLSKTNSAPKFLTTEAVNIYDMLREMIYIDAIDAIKEHHATVNLLVAKNVVVNGNRTLLYSIFFNLCSNALKYAGDAVNITIHNYMEDEDFYYFSFYDNGKGIEEKYLDHIFERFYRVTEGRSRDKGGSGLGLSIVKDAVNFHNGDISVKNRAQGGLEFLFTLKKK